MRRTGFSSWNFVSTVGVSTLCAAMLLACASPEAQVATMETTQTASADRKPEAATRSATPEFFPGRREVSVAELFQTMSAQADALAASQVLRSEYEALLEQHRLQHSADLYADFLRVRMASEATRAGGWWGLQWRVTNKEPNSEAIWSQWRASTFANTMPEPTTAVAECDELSALFAVVAHGLGLSKRSRVGLLWPTWNHTVAVWMIDDVDGRERARIVVPTSQIFLDGAQSLGTDRFDPWKQPKIYDYRRRDIAKETTLPAGLARYFLAQNARFGEMPRGELQIFRNLRESEQRRSPIRRLSSSDMLKNGSGVQPDR